MANRAGETYRVNLFNGEFHEFQIPRKSKPPALVDVCCQHLEIEETDYFSIYTEIDGNRTLWLQPDKPLRKQLLNYSTELYFGVKFYHMDPSKLYTEQTRLYFVQQIIDDITRKRSTITFMEDELNQITSLHIQSQLGDYEEGTHLPGYTKDLLLFNFQTPDLEDEMSRLHKTHSGKTPAQCEEEILKQTTNKRLYGLHIYHCQRMLGREQENVNIGIHPAGIVYLDDENNATDEFPWELVTKIETKRRKFILRIRNPVTWQASDEVQPKQDQLGTEEADISPDKAGDETDSVKPETQETKPPDADSTLIEPSQEQPKVEVEPKSKPEKRKGRKAKQAITIHTLLVTDKLAAKNLWRLAVEHHMFFQRDTVPEPKFSLFRSRSRYRFSGRTFRQAQQVHSEQSFTPFNPDVRTRLSLRKKEVKQEEIDLTSSFSGYVRAKDTTFRYPQLNESSNYHNTVEVPEPNSEEAAMQKEVTNKFLEQEYDRAKENPEDLPPPPDQETLSSNPELASNSADTVPEMPPPAPNVEIKGVVDETKEIAVATPED